MSSRPPIALYNGSGRVADLLGYRRVVLQPDRYTPEELADLATGGTQPLAHLTLSEDPGAPAPWQRTRRSPERGTALVHADHPGWTDRVRSEAAHALEAGFAGLFLDSLEVEWTHPEDMSHLLGLVADLRRLAGPAYLLANRGFGMLPRLAELVDGVLFEAFSSRWVEGRYALWTPEVLDAHAKTAEALLGYDLNLYALDYAADEELSSLVEQRARRFGMTCFVTDHALSRLPELAPVR
jgi:hypothetical protein